MKRKNDWKKRITAIVTTAVMASVMAFSVPQTAGTVYAADGEPAEAAVSETELSEPAGESPTGVPGDSAVQLEPGAAPETAPVTMEEPEAEPPADPAPSAEPTENTTPAQESGPAPAETPDPASGQTPESDSAPAEEPFFGSMTTNGVTITVSAPAGVFPAGSVLSAESVPNAEVEDAIGQEREKDRSVAVSYTFDIKVLDPAGNELQPADDQKVQVSFRTAEAADENLDTQVWHISESDADGTLDAEALETTTAGQTVTAEADGFSYYTVEFTYGSLQYVLPGEESIPVSEILDKVGLKGTATNVRVSNESLFSASDESGEWIITSHAPFSSIEKMFVTIAEIEYEIIVTDAQTITYYDPTSGTTSSVTQYREVTAADTSWSQNDSAWYVASGTLTIDNLVTVKGSVNLILTDSAVLTVNKGIKVDGDSNSLTIYAQTKDNKGTLTVTGEENQAGIGGGNSGNGGGISINGGNIDAAGGKYAAGIGGGKNGDGGIIIINGGVIKAAGGIAAAGIGGGLNRSGGVITINGGRIINSSGGNGEDGGGGGAGIGGGGTTTDVIGINLTNGGFITISGGTIEKAAGGNNAAGIGGGSYGTGGVIDISGGEIQFAKGGKSGAGIGGGYGSSGGTITISGGLIKEAEGGYGDNLGNKTYDGGAGIGGGGHGGGSGTITIKGDAHIVLAQSIGDGAGIGGGQGGDGETIIIEDKAVIEKADGSVYGAGIGSGDKAKTSGSITISGGDIKAKGGGLLTAGIGGGRESDCGTITISGGKVSAQSGDTGIGSGGTDNTGGRIDAGKITISGGTVSAKGINGAGIGGGKNTNAKTITITGGTITASSTNGAGIGGGENCSGGKITITNGTITSAKSFVGAGIGGGEFGSGGEITITGGRIQEAKSNSGAGIGGGWKGEGGSITVSGAVIELASGGEGGGAGIGGGQHKDGGTIIIKDGAYVVAKAGPTAAGIGGGGGDDVDGEVPEGGGSGGTIIIGSEPSDHQTQVFASGSRIGAGIGGGGSNSGGKITINGGSVVAKGEDGAAGIGGGLRGSGGEITIRGGVITATSRTTGIGIGNGESCSEENSGTLTLTYDEFTMAGMSVTSSGYSGKVTIASGKSFTDGRGNSYQGTLSEQNKEAINGKTIVPGNGTYYLDADGNEAGPVSVKIIGSTTNNLLEGSASGDWYYVPESVSLTSLNVSGNVNIILGNKTNLKIAQITIGQNASLTIWAQSTGSDMGTLTVKAISSSIFISGTPGNGSFTVNGGKVNTSGAIGINIGTLTVNSGSISAGSNGIGIQARAVTVNGGSISASGGLGITAETVTVNGGSVTADGSQYGIAVENSSGDAVLIVSGGTVTAASSSGEGGIYVSSSGAAKASFSGGTTKASGTRAVTFQSDTGTSIIEFNNMAVYDDEDSDQPVKASERANCLTTGYAKITACTHDSLIYIDNHEGKHTANCDSCGYSDGKLYDHNYVNHFCVCGAEQPNHKVTFYANNGTADSAEQKVYDGEETQLKANSFSWADHEFAGWNSEDNGSGTPYAADAKVTFAAGDEDLVLYGQWTLGAVNAPQITADPGNLSLTYGEEEGNSLSVTAAADEGCTLTYQWYSYTKVDKSDLQAVAGAQTGQYVIPAGTNAGTYFFYCEVTAVRTEDSQTSEPAASKAAKVEIAQREVTVTVEDAEDETYDGGVHTGISELSFTGILEGHTASITYIPAKGSAPSTYTGSFGDDFKVVDGDNNDVTGNYNLVNKTAGSITVIIDSDKPVITVKANSTGPLAYDGKEHSAKGFETLEFEFNGYKYTVEGLSTTDPSGTDVCSLSNEITGDAIVRNAAHEDVTAAFDVYTENGCLQITQRKLTVTANDKTAAYNGAIQGPGDASYNDPAQIADMVTADGLQGDDKLTSVEVDGQGTDAGEYALIPGAARVNDDDTATGNYDIHYENGKLTIGKAKLTITAKPQTYEYTGEPQGPAGTYTADFDTYVEVDGLQGSDALSGITLSGAETDAGVYEGEIVPSGAAVTFGHETEKTITDNYNVTYVNGDLTINAVPISGNVTLTTADAEATYSGAPLAVGTATAVDKNGGAVKIEYQKADGTWMEEPSGITATNVSESMTVNVRASGSNYTGYVTGTQALTIKPKAVTITVNSASKVVGEGDPAFTGSVDGLVKDDDLGVIRYVRTNIGVEEIDTYPGVLTAEYTENDNYDVGVTNGDFTIEAAPPGVYEVVSGADGTWTKGSTDTLQFIVKRTEDDDKTFGCFAGLEVNGTAVPEKDDSGKANYTAEAGSVIIDLQPSFLETLAKGKNTIAVLFTDGDPAAADFTILTEPVKPTPSPTPDPTVTPSPTNKPSGGTSSGKSSAPTGDNSPAELWLILLAAAAAGAAATLRRRRSRG